MEDKKITEIIEKISVSLSDELKENANECSNLDELIIFAGKEGIELPDELLEPAAGGYDHYEMGTCIKCGAPLDPDKPNGQKICNRCYDKLMRDVRARSAPTL